MITRALCLLLLASSLGAQTPAKEASAPVTVMSDIGRSWKQSTDYLARSAAAVPDSLYGFRPTATVRTFGQMLGHVAGSQNMFCAMVLGEKVPAEDEIEKTRTTKAALIQALAESNTYCNKAYALPDDAIGATVDVFGRPGTKRSVLMLNATHNYEHYGNIITYMRMNGMVPPSSQPRQ